MKQRLLFAGCLVVIASLAQAQHLKLFRSIVYTSDHERIEGILYDMTDSTLCYVPNQPDVIEQLRAGQTPPVQAIHWREIDRLVIRRRGHAGRGFLLGTGIGLTGSLAIAAFTRSDGGKGIGALSDVLRTAAIVGYPIGGAFYGTLLSFIPYKVRRIRQSEAAYKEAKATLKWRSVAAQRRVYGLPVESDSQSVHEPMIPY